MKPERRGRIDHEIQRAIAKIIGEEIKDPRLGFVTVTRAEITGDMKHCKVHVSVIGDRHVARQSMDVLESAKGFIRGRLGEEVKLRNTPELTFVEDRSTERAIEMTYKVDKAAAVSSGKTAE
ncbi:MAG: 30S ribosome-binding factor RbfA [Vulcanimicrobiaceae bacterium]